MNEKYLRGAYKQLGVTRPYEEWVSKISKNDKYLVRMHKALGVTRPYDEWRGKVFGIEPEPQPEVKKNEPSEQDSQPPTKPFGENGVLNVGFKASDEAVKTEQDPLNIDIIGNYRDHLAKLAMDKYQFEDKDDAVHAMRESGDFVFYSSKNGEPLTMKKSDIRGALNGMAFDLNEKGVLSSPDIVALKDDEKAHLLYKFRSTYIDESEIEKFFIDNNWDYGVSEMQHVTSQIGKGAGTMVGGVIETGDWWSNIMLLDSPGDERALQFLIDGARIGKFTRKQYEQKRAEFIEKAEGNDYISFDHKNYLKMSFDDALAKEKFPTPTTPSGDFNKFITEYLPSNPEYLDSFWMTDVPNGGGSLAAMAAVGLSTGGTGVVPFSIASEAGNQRASAIEAGDADSGQAMAIGAVTGAIEGFGATRLGKKLSKITKGKGTGVRGVVGSGVREGITEGVQGVINEYTAQQLYDETREIFDEGLLREMAVGTVLGSGSTSIAQTRRYTLDLIRKKLRNSDVEGATELADEIDSTLNETQNEEGAPVDGQPDKGEESAEAQQEEAEQVEDTTEQSVSEYDPYSIYTDESGNEGNIRLDGQTVVFESGSRIVELGNVDEISDKKLSEFGLTKNETISIELYDDGTVVMDGKKYKNNYSDPKAAINTDEDGNVISVNLETESGQKRTIRGERAEQIAYEIKLKEFVENGTPEQVQKLEDEIASYKAEDVAPEPQAEEGNTQESVEPVVPTQPQAKPTTVEPSATKPKKKVKKNLPKEDGKIEKDPTKQTVSQRISAATNAFVEALKKTDFSQKEVQEKANKYIDEVGYKAAFEAAKEMKASSKTAVQAEVVARLVEKQREKKLTKQEENDLYKYNEELSLSAEEGGRGSAQFNAVYEAHPELKVFKEVEEELSSIKKKNEAALEEDYGDGRKNRDVVNEATSALETELEKKLKEDVKNLVSKNKALQSALKKAAGKKVSKTDNKKASDKKTAEIKKRRKQAIEDIKKSLGKQSNTLSMSLIPVAPATVEAVARLVRTYVDQGIIEASKIYNAARSELKGVMSKEQLDEALDQIQEYRDAIELEAEQGGGPKSKQALKSTIGLPIDRIVQDILSGRAGTKDAVAKRVAEELGLSDKGAKAVAKMIDNILSERVGKILSEKLAPKKEVSKKASKKMKGDQALTNRVIELIQAGALGTPQMRDAFSDKFGFKRVPLERVNYIRKLAEQLVELTAEDGVRKHEEISIISRELNGELERLKKMNPAVFYRVGMDLSYAAVLSGLMTQIRAAKGAIMQGTVYKAAFVLQELFAVNAFKPGRNAKRIARAFKEEWKSIPAASRRAKLSRLSNNSVFETMEAFEEGLPKKTAGRLDRALQKGFKQTAKESKGAKRAGKMALLAAIQYRKMMYLLSAFDGFVTTASSTFVTDLLTTRKISAENPEATFEEIQRIADENISTDQEYTEQAKKDYKDFIRRVKEAVEADNTIPDDAKDSAFERQKKVLDAKGYVKRRVRELKDGERREVYERAVEMVREWILLGEPDGISGYVYDKYKKHLLINDSDGLMKATLKFMGSMTLLFPRLSANVINQITLGVPFAGMAFSKAGITKDADGKWGFGLKKGPMSNAKFVISSAFTLAGVYLFADMFDMDEEGTLILNPDREFDVTAGGAAMRDKVGVQKAKWGIRRRQENGEWGDYTSLDALPMAAGVIGTLGYYSDLISMKQGEKRYVAYQDATVGSKISNVTDALSAVYSEGGGFNSIGRMLAKFGYNEPADAAKMILVDAMAQSAGRPFAPLLYRDVKDLAMVNAHRLGLADEPTQKTPPRWKENNYMEYMAKSALRSSIFEDFVLDEKTDPFGNTYPKKDIYSRLVSKHFEEHEDISELEREFKGLLRFPKKEIKLGQEITLFEHGKQSVTVIIPDTPANIKKKDELELEYKRALKEAYKAAHSNFKAKYFGQMDGKTLKEQIDHAAKAAEMMVSLSEQSSVKPSIEFYNKYKNDKSVIKFKSDYKYLPE